MQKWHARAIVVIDSDDLDDQLIEVSGDLYARDDITDAFVSSTNSEVSVEFTFPAIDTFASRVARSIMGEVLGPDRFAQISGAIQIDLAGSTLTS